MSKQAHTLPNEVGIFILKECDSETLSRYIQCSRACFGLVHHAHRREFDSFFLDQFRGFAEYAPSDPLPAHLYNYLDPHIARDDNGRTLLHHAVRHGDPRIVTNLLARGADLAATDEYGNTPLHVLTLQNESDGADYIHVISASSREYPGEHNITSLAIDSSTIRMSSPSSSENLSIQIREWPHPGEYYQSVTTGGSAPTSPLASALQVPTSNSRASNSSSTSSPPLTGKPQYLTCLKLLLEHAESLEGKSPSVGPHSPLEHVLAARNLRHKTPVHHCCERGNVAMLEELLRRGGAPDMPDLKEKTPLFYLCQANGIPLRASLRAARTLIRRFAAEVDAENMFLQRPLHVCASRSAKTELARLLLDEGALVDPADAIGQTPLHVAAKYGNLATVKLLLEREANPGLVDARGRTPAHNAAANGHEAVFMILRDTDPGAADILDVDGLTALELASVGMKRRVDTVRRGGDYDIRMLREE